MSLIVLYFRLIISLIKFLFVVFILAFNQVLTNNNVKLTKSYSNCIKLIIKGTGTLNFLSNSFTNTYYPNSIKVDGINVGPNITSYSFSSSPITVELIWNNFVKDCYRMFYG